MTDIATLTLSCVAGGALGTLFYFGLWLTIRAVVTRGRSPALFFPSLLARVAIAVIGLWLVAAGDWQRLSAGLAGFLIARIAVSWSTRPAEGSRSASQP